MRQIYPQRLTPIGPHNPVWKIPTSEKLETPTPLPRPQLATPARQRSVQWKLSSAIEANHYWSNKKTLNLLVIRNKRQIFCLIESFWRRNLSCVVESSLVILNIDLLGLVWRKREIFEGFLASLSWPKDALGGLLENFVLSVFCFCSFDFFFTLKFTLIVVLFWNSIFSILFSVKRIENIEKEICGVFDLVLIFGCRGCGLCSKFMGFIFY